MDSKRNERRKRALNRLEKELDLMVERLEDMKDRSKRIGRKEESEFLESNAKSMESSINKKNKEIGILKSRIL